MLHLLAHLNVLYQTSQDAIPQFFHNCTVLPTNIQECRHMYKLLANTKVFKFVVKVLCYLM